jgi:hypothetical protein
MRPSRVAGPAILFDERAKASATHAILLAGRPIRLAREAKPVARLPIPFTRRGMPFAWRGILVGKRANPFAPRAILFGRLGSRVACMPWKIVNLDYACDRPHLHMKDPNQPIHLRAYLTDQRVEVSLGADDPEDCPVRAFVSPDDVLVQATKFEPLHVKILESILGSLDVEPRERDDAMDWMHERVERRAFGPDGWLAGNVASFPLPSGWPYDLTDAALLDSIRDSKDIPNARRQALAREARRRGLGAGGGAPEVLRRPRR